MSNQFSRELLKVVLAQWCKGIGFKAIQQSACDALIDILELYIEEIGYSSHTYAEHASRTESNFNDLRLAFEDIGVDLQDLQNYAVNAEEIPFCKPVPKFPLIKTTTDANGNANANNDDDKKKDKDKVETLLSNSEPSTLPSHSHIPPFLPALPSHHTYISTPIFGKVITDPVQIRRERTKQRRQIEQSLVKLSETAHVPPVKDYEATKQKIKNPYLKTPQSTTSTSTKPSTIKNFNTSHKNTSIRPTPLDNPEIFDQFVTENDDGIKPNNEFDDEEKNVRRLDGMEEGERAKKRQKALHILSLDHRDGKIPESLIDREARDNNNNNNNNNNIFNNNSNEGPQRVTETI